MKLTHYAIRKLLIPLILILGLWAVFFYAAILYEVYDETNDTLQNYKSIILKSITADSTLLKDHVDIMSRYYIQEVSATEAQLDKDLFYDSKIYIEIEDEFEPVRVLKTYFRADNNKYYELRIELSTLEKDNMLSTILLSLSLLFILLVICLLLVIHLTFRRTLKPLKTLIGWLENYNLGKATEKLESHTNVQEFIILNEAVVRFTERNQELYLQQRRFIENASHELQTPLAISMNKLELMSDHPDCTESLLIEIGDIQKTLRNSINLNKELLLLSKIDNNQYSTKEIINLNELIISKLEDFSEMNNSKEIRIDYQEEAVAEWSMNQTLAGILFTNLIRNAFVHTNTGGRIVVLIQANRIQVANTGMGVALQQESLFKRFHKQTDNNRTTGLGLAIVKSIVKESKLTIDYEYKEEMHFFTVSPILSEKQKSIE